MKQFQKIAIGLLGLTNPELFIPRSKPDAARKAQSLFAPASRPGRDPPAGRAVRVLRTLKFLLTALAIGSRKGATGR
jgi:hypothetical protein